MYTHDRQGAAFHWAWSRILLQGCHTLAYEEQFVLVAKLNVVTYLSIDGMFYIRFPLSGG